MELRRGRLGVAAGMALALLVLPSTARADLNPCQRYVYQEEKAAHERCVAKWQDLLPSAKEELALSPPQRIGNCGRRFDAWAAAAKTDPNDYDAMTRRLSARDAVESCNRSWLLDHAPREEKLRRASRGEILMGGILLGVGGALLTISGALGIVWLPDSTSTDGNPLGVLYPAMGGAFSGAIAIVGAVLLGVGARNSHLRGP